MPNLLLDREEYVEQAYFFRTFRDRMKDGIPSQEILQTINEEILSTTKLPTVLEFLAGEMRLHGRMSGGMAHLKHYFAPFQTFVMAQAEEERSRFEQTIALEILEKEAEYRSDGPGPQGLFIFQFESIARNRLGYDAGITAMAGDPVYDEDWRDWIGKVRQQLGTVDFSDLIYFRSQDFVDQRRRRSADPDYKPSYPILFGSQEGRIANANRGRDPLVMFGALQRHLGYPTVPKPKPKSEELILHPVVEFRLKQIEQRIKLLESEVLKGGLDLNQFYVKPEDFNQTDAPP